MTFFFGAMKGQHKYLTIAFISESHVNEMNDNISHNLRMELLLLLFFAI